MLKTKDLIVRPVQKQGRKSDNLNLIIEERPRGVADAAAHPYEHSGGRLERLPITRQLQDTMAGFEELQRIEGLPYN
jgi:hypothetical protein